MSTYFGIDAATPMQRIAESVHVFVGYLPSWAGRYLSTGGGAADPITAAEAAWMHSVGMRILLCWNDAGAGTVGGDRATGEQHGRAAVAAAVALKAPTGCWLPVDIEAGWNPSAVFIAGYLDACHAAGYVGGAYLNALQQSHTAPWIAARALTNAPGYVWSSTPEYDRWRGTIRDAWFDFSTTPLGAAQAGSVAAHQYSENELNGTIDLDVCTQACYDHLLWAPAALPVPAGRMKVIKAAGLKPAPKHGGANIAMIPAGGQILVTTQRQRDANGDTWALCQWRDATGWLVDSNITSL